MMSFQLTSFFFFNDTATTEIYTLSLHDALPIYPKNTIFSAKRFIGHRYNEVTEEAKRMPFEVKEGKEGRAVIVVDRSEEHTSELQSLAYLVCRLLLEKKKKIIKKIHKKKSI